MLSRGSYWYPTASHSTAANRTKSFHRRLFYFHSGCLESIFRYFSSSYWPRLNLPLPVYLMNHAGTFLFRCPHNFCSNPYLTIRYCLFVTSTASRYSTTCFSCLCGVVDPFLSDTARTSTGFHTCHTNFTRIITGPEEDFCFTTAVCHRSSSRSSHWAR